MNGKPRAHNTSNSKYKPRKQKCHRCTATQRWESNGLVFIWVFIRNIKNKWVRYDDGERLISTFKWIDISSINQSKSSFTFYSNSICLRLLLLKLNKIGNIKMSFCSSMESSVSLHMRTFLVQHYSHWSRCVLFGILIYYWGMYYTIS